MSIWQVQIHKTTIQSGTGRWYLKQNIVGIFKGLPNKFVIADGILIVGYNADSSDHIKTLRQVIKICW